MHDGEIYMHRQIMRHGYSLDEELLDECKVKATQEPQTLNYLQLGDSDSERIYYVCSTIQSYTQFV